MWSARLKSSTIVSYHIIDKINKRVVTILSSTDFFSCFYLFYSLEILFVNKTKHHTVPNSRFVRVSGMYVD